MAEGINENKNSAAVPNVKRRIELLDELRGAAVFCMVFYHGFFIVGYNFKIDFFKDLFDFFTPVQPFFASLFIFICGISSRLSRNNIFRGLRLAAVAAAISGFTVLICPLVGIEDADILFGILHLLALSILIFAAAQPVIETLNPIGGAFVCLLLFAVLYGVRDGYIYLPFKSVSLPESLYSHYYLFPFGFHTADFYSADYFPLLPYLFMFLAGCFAGYYFKAGNIPYVFYNRHVPFFGRLGRISLLVYVLHWPVLYLLTLIAVKISERF